MKSDRQSRLLFAVLLASSAFALAVNALLALPPYGWCVGLYLSFGLFVMCLVAVLRAGRFVALGILVALCLQLFNFACYSDFHELFIPFWGRCSDGEFCLGRFLVVGGLFLNALLAAAAVARSSGLREIFKPYFFEGVLLILFVNHFLCADALIANVLCVFVLSCFISRMSKAVLSGRVVMSGLLLSFSIPLFATSSMVEADGGQYFQLSFVRYITGNCSPWVVLSIHAAFVLGLTVCALRRRRLA